MSWLLPLILQERRYSGPGSTHTSRAPAKLRHSSTSSARLSSVAAFVYPEKERGGRGNVSEAKKVFGNMTLSKYRIIQGSG